MVSPALEPKPLFKMSERYFTSLRNLLSVY